MNFKKIFPSDLIGKGVLGMDDVPGLTAEEMQAKLDELASDVIVPAFNVLSTQLDGSQIDMRVLSDDVKALRVNLDKQLEVSYNGTDFEATGSSGHIIVSPNGNELPQRSRIKFTGEAIISDNIALNATEISAVKGDTGLRGERGIQGVQGEQGDVGKVYLPYMDDLGNIAWGLVNDSETIPETRNIKGPQGIQGSQGIQGVQGARGIQGERGEAGALGVQGVKGDTGAQGGVGAAGAKGERGETGSQGVQGVKGEAGVHGLIGATGAKGDRGETGMQGVQGIKGDTGAQGLVGAQGIQGVQGAQGAQGEDGAAGLDGRNFTVHGRYNSLLALQTDYPAGQDGDAWAVGSIANNNVYVWDINTNVWQNVGPIQGPMGPQGAQGVQGIEGKQGVQGIKGNAGAQGIQGAQGAQGEKGGTGASGAVGAKGDTGAQGTQGPQGIKGEKGDIGAKGDIGMQGAQGIQGERGAQGTKGDKGDTGFVGATGAQGVQGLQGERGIQGVQGERGVQGSPTIVNGKTGASISLTASDVGALAILGKAANSDRLNGLAASAYQLSTDSALQTVSKTVTGAINEAADMGISQYTCTYSASTKTYILSGKGPNIKFKAPYSFSMNDVVLIQGVTMSLRIQGSTQIPDKDFWLAGDIVYCIRDGNTLNFKSAATPFDLNVVGGMTKPLNPKDNTLWARCPEMVNKFVIRTLEHTWASTYEVSIIAGYTDEDVYLTLSKKYNLKIYPMQCFTDISTPTPVHRYENGIWKALPSNIYYRGYNTIGGWTSTSGGVARVEEHYIYIKGGNSFAKSEYGVDITNLSRIYVVASITSAVTQFTVYMKEKSDHSSTTIDKFGFGTAAVTEKEVMVDVSAYTGIVYFTTYRSSATDAGYCKIHRIYGE